MLLHRIKDKNKEKRDQKTIRICKSSKSNNYEKTLLKRNVLSKLLKLVKELANRILPGIEFHSLGAQLGRLYLQILTLLVGQRAVFELMSVVSG